MIEEMFLDVFLFCIDVDQFHERADYTDAPTPISPYCAASISSMLAKTRPITSNSRRCRRTCPPHSGDHAGAASRTRDAVLV